MNKKQNDVNISVNHFHLSIHTQELNIDFKDAKYKTETFDLKFNNQNHSHEFQVSIFIFYNFYFNFTSGTDEI